MLQLARNIKLTTKKAHHCKRNIRRGVLPISVISRHNKKILQRNRRHRSLDLKVPNTPLKPIATVAYTLFSSHHFPHLLFFPLFLCSPSVESMGAEVKIWNPVEVAEQARHDYASQIHSSHLTIDPSLELPLMAPLVLFVILPPRPLSFLSHLLLNKIIICFFPSFFSNLLNFARFSFELACVSSFLAFCCWENP